MNYSALNDSTKCSTLNRGAIFCCSIFLASLCLNVYVLALFCLKKEFHAVSNRNLYLITLTVSNLLGTVFIEPIWIVSNFYCRYLKYKCRVQTWIFCIILTLQHPITLKQNYKKIQWSQTPWCNGLIWRYSKFSSITGDN